MRILRYLGLFVVAVGVPVVAQEPAPIQGVITDEASWTPVPAAVVSLVGTGLRAVSTADGAFAFSAAPSGPVTVRVEAPGFTTVTEEVVVTNGRVVYAQFFLPRIEAVLDEIVVLGRRQDVLLKELRGVQRNTEVGSTEARVRMRGLASLTINTEPIIYLDGVRLAGGLGETLALLRRIPANDVTAIEIMRGPATGFQVGAADGAIHVRTNFGPPD
jgi:outer membrane cobalamin receptor